MTLGSEEAFVGIAQRVVQRIRGAKENMATSSHHRLLASDLVSEIT